MYMSVCDVPCRTVSYCVVPCRTVSYCVVLCRTVSYCVVLCRTVSYCVVLCRTVSVLYDTLYDTVRRVVHPRRVGPRRLVRHCTTRRTLPTRRAPTPCTTPRRVVQCISDSTPLSLPALTFPLHFPFLSLGRLCHRSPRTVPVPLPRGGSTRRRAAALAVGPGASKWTPPGPAQNRGFESHDHPSTPQRATTLCPRDRLKVRRGRSEGMHGKEPSSWVRRYQAPSRQTNRAVGEGCPHCPPSAGGSLGSWRTAHTPAPGLGVPHPKPPAEPPPTQRPHVRGPKATKCPTPPPRKPQGLRTRARTPTTRLKARVWCGVSQGALRPPRNSGMFGGHTGLATALAAGLPTKRRVPRHGLATSAAIPTYPSAPCGALHSARRWGGRIAHSARAAPFGGAPTTRQRRLAIKRHPAG